MNPLFLDKAGHVSCASRKEYHDCGTY